MNRSFSNFKSLAIQLASDTTRALVSAEAGLGVAARLVQNEARAKVGHYQAAAGPFPAWAALAESTERQKEAQGYPADAPLLRTGELERSIVTESHPTEAIIGSQLKVAAYQEFGTDRIPPRPFLGPAAFENGEKIAAIVGRAAMSGLAGTSKPNPALGYDQELS